MSEANGKGMAHTTATMMHYCLLLLYEDTAAFRVQMDTPLCCKEALKAREIIFILQLQMILSFR